MTSGDHTSPAGQRREGEGEPREFSVPRYVYACAGGKWHLKTCRFDQKTGEVLSERRVPFRCRSWRHPGPCRRWRAAQNFARIQKAFLRYRTEEVCFLVLTLDPKDWKDRYQAFAELKERWRSLAKAIRRRHGKFENVSTVEVTRRGWAHLNVVIASRSLANECIARRPGEKPVKRGSAHAWFWRHAQDCGFGQVLTIERASSRRALAGYVVKVAGEVEMPASRGANGEVVGEVVKFTQLPEQAPRHFRRLRSSVRFLEKPFKREDVTGELVRSPLPAEAGNVGEPKVTELPWGKWNQQTGPPG